MAPIRNAAILFNEVPTGYPEPGKTTIYDTNRTIDLANVPLNGGVLVKVLVLSNDPYMRGRMHEPSNKRFAEPMFVRGEPLANLGVGRVVRSEDANYDVGDHVYGFLTFEEYSIVHSNIPGIPPMSKLPNKKGLPWSVYVGAAGMPGMTAYFGYHEYAEAKRGQTIFVSSGAGAVGSQVIQLAKLDGLKVIASAGSDDKVAFMKEIGADVAFNYKTTNVDEVLEKEGPLDIYWDHVGGSTLDSALGQMNLDGRVLVCGMIAGYNVGQAYSYKNLAIINSRTLLVKGFYVMDPRLIQKWSASFSREVPALLANGNLKYKEDKTPFAQTGEAIRDLHMGKNNGKSVIIVSEDE